MSNNRGNKAGPGQRAEPRVVRSAQNSTLRPQTGSRSRDRADTTVDESDREVFGSDAPQGPEQRDAIEGDVVPQRGARSRSAVPSLNSTRSSATHPDERPAYTPAEDPKPTLRRSSRSREINALLRSDDTNLTPRGRQPPVAPEDLATPIATRVVLKKTRSRARTTFGIKEQKPLAVSSLPPHRARSTSRVQRGREAIPEDGKRILSTDFAAPQYDGAPKETSLRNILELCLAPSPPFYLPNDIPETSTLDDAGRPHVLNSTKSLTDNVVQFDTHARIQWVVFAEGMLLPFIREAERRTEELWFSWANPRAQVPVNLIHPWTTQTSLPAHAHCEQDIVTWISTSITRPISVAWKILDARDVTTERIFDRRNCPFWTAGDQNHKATGKSLPDGVLMKRWSSYDDKDIPLVLEAKCDNVLRGYTKEDLPSGTRAAVWRSLMAPIYDASRINVKGDTVRALPFNWPTTTTDGNNDMLTRVIVQIVMEMGDNLTMELDVGDLAILSSYQSTFFMVKKGDTLYISPNYGPRDKLLMATFAFTCAAMGTFGNLGFNLPEKADKKWCNKEQGTGWRKELSKSEKGGIPDWALPDDLHRQT